MKKKNRHFDVTPTSPLEPFEASAKREHAPNIFLAMAQAYERLGENAAFQCSRK